MTMTAREAFERGTKAFNAHDINGFAEVLADDVVFQAQADCAARERQRTQNFFAAFPDAPVDVHDIPIVVEKGELTGTHKGACLVRHGLYNLSAGTRCASFEGRSQQRQPIIPEIHVIPFEV